MVSNYFHILHFETFLVVLNVFCYKWLYLSKLLFVLFRYYYSMSEQEVTSEPENSIANNENDQNKMEVRSLEQEIFVDDSKRITFKSFLKTNAITLIFMFLSAIAMIIGLFLFYWLEEELIKNAGFWLIISGVVAFLLTIIFGFQKLE